MISSKKRLRLTAGVNDKRRITSNIYGGSVNFTGGPGMVSVSAFSGQGNTPTSMLLGIMSEDERSLQAMYTDMYNYDSVCGTTIDLKSTLACSDFNLSGCVDPKRLEVYRTNLERLGYPGIMPQVYMDYYARGKYISTLIHNSERKLFTDQMVHSAADCEILNSPLHGIPPLIKLKPNESVKRFFSDQNPHTQEVIKRLNPEFVNNMLTQEVVLDPLATLYIPRLGISGVQKGQSMLRRIIPLYFLEKVLLRGTIAEAQKRQRSTLHIQAGGENWQPVEEDLQMLVGLFQQADLDPVGAILATRNDINTSEIRNGGDFWKYTDISDVTSSMKLRIMGVSETFLSGESSYNAMEVALSVFIENIRSDRDYLTRVMFKEHLFPLIAHVNDFVKESRSKHFAVLSSGSTMHFDMSDPGKYDIPKVTWTKSLRPEADRDYMEILDMMKEKGVPVPLAMIAAAGGLSLDETIAGFEDDLKTRKTVAEYMKKVEALSGGEQAEESAVRAMLQQAGIIKRKPLSILSREFDTDLVDRTVTGKRKSVPTAVANARRDKLNKICAGALKRLATDDNAFALRNKQARSLIANNQIIHNDGGIERAL